MFVILDPWLTVTSIADGDPDSILLVSCSRSIPSEMLIPYSSNTFWKLGIFILVTFASENNIIFPPFFIYFIMASFSIVFISSFNVVITSVLQSSGIFPVVSKSKSSTSFASFSKLCLKLYKYEVRLSL